MLAPWESGIGNRESAALVRAELPMHRGNFLQSEMGSGQSRSGVLLFPILDSLFSEFTP